MIIQEVYKDYLDHLMKGDRFGCYEAINNAVDKQVSIRELYNLVFYPAMVKVGELWQNNQFTVAQEHLATAITQSVMASLYHKMFAGISKSIEDGKDKKILILCPGQELHELGARMLADLLELEGYNVLYLGANMPTDSVLDMIDVEVPSLIGLSCTMSFNVRYVKETIEKIRCKFGNRYPILVGGMTFNIDETLVQYVEADYYCRDSDAAIEMVKKLIV